MSGASQAHGIEICVHSAQSRAMNRSWKTIWMAALGTMCTAVAASAQADPTLTVVVYDYAGLSDECMNEMETLSALLLSRAGLQTQWVHCLGRQQGPRPAQCDANLETGSVLIRILDHPGNPNKL